MFKIFVAIYLLAGGPPMQVVSSTHVYETKAECEVVAKSDADTPGSPQSLVKYVKDTQDIDVKVVAACAPAEGAPPDFPSE